MSQFTSTEHANAAFVSALNGYNKDEQRINSIKEDLKANNMFTKDLEWLCDTALFGIMQQRNSWYSHD